MFQDSAGCASFRHRIEDSGRIKVAYLDPVTRHTTYRECPVFPVLKRHVSSRGPGAGLAAATRVVIIKGVQSNLCVHKFIEYLPRNPCNPNSTILTNVLIVIEGDRAALFCDSVSAAFNLLKDLKEWSSDLRWTIEYGVDPCNGNDSVPGAFVLGNGFTPTEVVSFFPYCLTFFRLF